MERNSFSYLFWLSLICYAYWNGSVQIRHDLNVRGLKWFSSAGPWERASDLFCSPVYSLYIQDTQALQGVVHSAERIIRSELPDQQSIYTKRCPTEDREIMKDLCRPDNGLISLLKTGKCFCSIKAKTERMRQAIQTQAIQALNQVQIL